MNGPSSERLQNEAPCHGALVYTTARPPDLTTCFLFLVLGDLIRLQVAATSRVRAFRLLLRFVSGMGRSIAQAIGKNKQSDIVLHLFL